VELPDCTVAVEGVTLMLVRMAVGRVVVRFVLALMPCEEAVIRAVPPTGPPAPVASPLGLMLATFGLLLVNEKVIPLIGFPY